MEFFKEKVNREMDQQYHLGDGVGNALARGNSGRRICLRMRLSWIVPYFHHLYPGSGGDNLRGSYEIKGRYRTYTLIA